MKVSTVLIAGLVLIIIALGVFYVRQNDSSQPNERNDSPTAADSASSSTSQIDPATAGRSISYTGSAFVPETVTIEVGTAVIITNDSRQSVEIASDPHPDHSANQELNVGTLEPGERLEVTLNQKGDWGYHNDPSATATGVIQVR